MNLHTENAQQNVIKLLSEKISDLEFQVRNSKKVIDFIKPYAIFYLLMQQKIINDENIMNAWKRFIAMTKLTIDKEKGITE